MFKKGDIIQHKASGQKALITAVSNNCYILSYDIDGHVNICQEDAEFVFELYKENKNGII